jgi:hypothetical protein
METDKISVRRKRQFQKSRLVVIASSRFADGNMYNLPIMESLIIKWQISLSTGLSRQITKIIIQTF